ncbi:aminotransferase class V-fold PLP-dependent enzyme [Candidatus Vidania fulgoroideorum]
MIYFNNSSYTRVDYKVIRKMNYNKINYNSSVENKLIIEKNRKKISKILKCKKKEFFFTPSCTISNNIILSGFLNKRNNYIIITTKTEHLSLLKTIKNLKNKTLFFKCHKNGLYNLKDLKNKFSKKNKYFLALTYVNNETGVIQKINKIIKLKKKYKFKIFIDCSQALGKCIRDLKGIKADFISISSNKIHGPIGIAGLFIKKSNIKKIKPIFYGGEQENKICSGTLSLSLVLGFTEAIKIQYKEFLINNNIVNKINNYFIKKIKKNNNIKLNSSLEKVPHIINFYIKDILSPIYKRFFKKIIFSNSSTCLMNKKKSSYVLKEMRKSKIICENSIRISFSKYNRVKEIKTFYKIIKNLIFLFKN